MKAKPRLFRRQCIYLVFAECTYLFLVLACHDVVANAFFEKFYRDNRLRKRRISRCPRDFLASLTVKAKVVSTHLNHLMAAPVAEWVRSLNFSALNHSIISLL